MMKTRRAAGGSRRAFVTLACAIAWMACAVTHASAATYTCTAQCDSSAATTSQCGSGNVLSASTACSAAHTTYEGCTATVCNAACASATTDKVETVTYSSKTYKCFNATNYMHMSNADAIEQSVSKNCGPGSHQMGSMYMAGAMHTTCDNWSNAASPAGASASATAVFAVAAACALMLA